MVTQRALSKECKFACFVPVAVSSKTDGSVNPIISGLQENESISDELDSSETKMKLANYKYPFENLIFEGGGNKGLAYCGAIKVGHVLSVSAVSCFFPRSGPD